MNRYHVLTLFPEMIENGLKTSITGRAIEQQLIGLNAVNIRDFADNKHNKVDDYPYGGGAGMVMQAEPVYRAWESVTGKIGRKARTIYVTPQGAVFNQKMAEELAKEEDVIFLCGHYEGVDERVLEEIVTDYVSIGDYVLTGGEFPAMVMIDAVSRLVPGVLNNEDSAEFESFQDGLLEYPQYSRPEIWHEKEVPPVLLSGNHTHIEGWRQELSILRTRERRPDLYDAYLQAEEERIMEGKQKRRRFRGVIFDMDGCLVDSERVYAQCWQRAFDEKGIPLSPEILHGWNGLGRNEINGQILQLTGNEALTEELGETMRRFVAEERDNGRIPLRPYAREILMLVREKGLKLGLASSTVKERAELMLNSHGLLELFDFTTFGSEVAHTKPAPDIYRLALKKAGLKASEAIAFEDSISGVTAARRAGIRTVYIPQPDRRKEEPEMNYYRKIGDFAEGMAILRAMP
ncbi:tRNA (guanosine(37)-N1)-methyltransferase TrmD [Anaerosacchariphilus sp. NSJ-68]|uniref:tRNA (guanine-N(1)-)-methyltransferase n=3 Tax=Lachnospirales TaxID=3085636 RepID=A0A923RM55_9FIRM|nr:tRNA (guanosine(37)-N1)-methyltransferase TrmD [Anaerosacchariphilus hominis]MBC5697586.1 tRNA (guanosine(37)-N1)-methyltransferase TrmD [Roseburia difficilis]